MMLSWLEERKVNCFLEDGSSFYLEPFSELPHTLSPIHLFPNPSAIHHLKKDDKVYNVSHCPSFGTSNEEFRVGPGR